MKVDAEELIKFHKDKIKEVVEKINTLEVDENLEYKVDDYVDIIKREFEAIIKIEEISEDSK